MPERSAVEARKLREAKRQARCRRRKLTQRDRGCVGKIRYDTEATAKRNRDRLLGGPRHPYPCQSCGGWHLSSRH